MSHQMQASKKPLWQPEARRIECSKLSDYQRMLQQQHGLEFSNYQSLHQWSVENPGLFWESVWKFGDVRAAVTYSAVVENENNFPILFCNFKKKNLISGSNL